MSEVFLVEDSDLDTMLFEKVMELSTASSVVRHFTTATDCINNLLDRLNKNLPLPSLIVLDIFLDGERGESVMEFVDGHLPQKLPIVVLSASMGLIDDRDLKVSKSIKLLSSKPITKAKLNGWISSKLIA
jgi:CheY-like chemotaxis protein